MAFAVIAGLDYDSPVVEFNVRPEPGTAPDVIVLKVQKGQAKLEILEVKPDNQGIKQPDGQVYQWFKLKFANGQTGWLRSHILTIEGDCTGFGYGTISSPTYAYKLNRVVAVAAPAPFNASRRARRRLPVVISSFLAIRLSPPVKGSARLQRHVILLPSGSLCISAGPA